MKRDQLRREQMRAMCGELHEDDGVDPREYFASGRGRHKRDRKADQLCHQVKQTIELVLAGEFDDDLLLGLQVVSVSPEPDTAQLAVRVATLLPPDRYDADAITRRLSEVAPFIRSQVAQAITRKRAPKLVFHLCQLPGGEEGR